MPRNEVSGMTNKRSVFLKALFHPREFFDVLSKDRYSGLKLKIVLLDAILSLVPLFIVVTVSYFWFQHILKEDFHNQMRWQIENTKQSIEFFVEEKLSSLRFLASAYPYEELSDQKKLSDVFSKFKKESPGLVDLGVIDSHGIQRSYVGPYRLEGKDYSTQDWFHEVVIRSAYVSDVFLGYRRLPHFAIAVKREVPEKRTFWVLRATIDVATLKRFVSSINLTEKDDAFIVNYGGFLQTPSRFQGDVLEKFKLPLPFPQQGVSLVDTKQTGNPVIAGYGYIKHSPWVLVTIIKSTPYAKIPKIFRNELFLITVISVFFGIAVTTRIAHTLVNRIKEAEQEREDAIAKTEHANKLASIGRLAAGVAHEINNPLAIINEKAGLMKDILEVAGDLQENREKFLVQISAIFESVNRCRTITQRLLGFARRMEPTHEVVDINETMREVIEFLSNEILSRNILLEVRLREDLPKVESDKGQLQQVFLNIINNAIDAVEKEGFIEISTDVRDKNAVKVSIRDNGRGISRDQLKHLFEPFYSTKEKEKGTGLGLFISYGIMKRLGGTILVESEINKGSTFTVEIPIKFEIAEGRRT